VRLILSILRLSCLEVPVLTRLTVARFALFAGASLLVLPLAPAAVPLASAPAPTRPAQTDLDAFMADVLERRDENWKKLQQYVLDERELVRVLGPSRMPLWGERREYMWYIREGFFIRSPVKANGVTVPEEERRRYEERYFQRAVERDRRERERELEKAAEEAGLLPPSRSGRGGLSPLPADPPIPQAPPDVQGLIVQTRQPGFIDSAYFLEFEFEQGTYALVGREPFEGFDVLRVEYYPEKRLFTHEQDDQAQRQRRGRTDREEDVEATMERLMNKVSLVTLWIEPASRQIVKYTFDNVNLDFLPAAWLVRVNDVKATMTMSRPFPDNQDVWLPRDVEMLFSAMLAVGELRVDYQIGYENYQEARTSGRIIGRGGGGGGGE
jgi:hypothetical protein